MYKSYNNLGNEILVKIYLKQFVMDNIMYIKDKQVS